MKFFEDPKMECVKFDVEDIVTASIDGSPDEGSVDGKPGGEDM